MNMEYSPTAYPNIKQAVFLILMVFVTHVVAKYLFSFVESNSLASLLGESFKLGLLALFLRYITKTEDIDTRQFRTEKPNVFFLLIGIIAALSIRFLPDFSYLEEGTAQHMVVDMINKESDFYSFISSVLVGPGFEELLFRGLILGGLLKRYKPVSAIFISAVIFGLLHPLNALSATLFGCLIGWIYYHTENLFYCIVIHGVANLFSLTFRYAIREKYTSLEQLHNFTETNAITVSVISAAILLVCIYRLNDFPKKVKFTDA
jgi:uncharacterized protein